MNTPYGTCVLQELVPHANSFLPHAAHVFLHVSSIRVCPQAARSFGSECIEELRPHMEAFIGGISPGGQPDVWREWLR